MSCLKNEFAWEFLIYNLLQSVFFQTFNAIFEAAIEGVATNQARGKNLTFEVSGDGNLPRINIQKPTVRNKRGQALMLFKKNLVNHSETMPLVLVNDGTLPSKVDIDLIDQDGVFQLKPADGTNAVMDDDYEGIYPVSYSTIFKFGNCLSERRF